MKTGMGMLAITVLFLASAGAVYAETDNLSGKWRGFITERGRSTLVELDLREGPDTIEGQFSVLDKTEEDVDQGMSFEIRQVERSGRELRFIVPLTGEIDEDSILLDLVVRGNSLIGQGRELREGSERLPITFTKCQ